MPVAPAPETVPFDLGGMEELARAASPELAEQVTKELGDAPPAPPTPPEGEAPLPPAADPDKKPDDEIEVKSTEDELTELNRQSEEAKAKAETAPPVVPETVAPPVTPAPVPRDDDLKLDEKFTSHLHPKTKKVLDDRSAKIIAERNRADALAKEKLDLQAKLSTAEEAAKKIVVPKNVEDELATLRERVRELDINHDPELVAKYDAPVKANRAKIVAILSDFGLGKTADGKPDPAALDALQKSGLDFKALAPYIKKLSDAGAEDAAEEVREILRENIRLAREREREVASWKTGYETKQAARQQEAKQGQAKVAGEVRAHTENFLKADVAALTKEFAFMARPPDPLPTDAPAVAKAKADAVAAYEATGAAVEATIATLDASKAPPEKAVEVHGRLAAAAVAGVIIRQHILPRLAKDLAALTARNKELEAQMGKLKTAGSLSRAHAAAASAPPGTQTKLPEDTMDAARQIAKEMGVAADT